MNVKLKFRQTHKIFTPYAPIKVTKTRKEIKATTVVWKCTDDYKDHFRRKSRNVYQQNQSCFFFRQRPSLFPSQGA